MDSTEISASITTLDKEIGTSKQSLTGRLHKKSLANTYHKESEMNNSKI
jgi:hypothetical protein